MQVEIDPRCRSAYCDRRAACPSFWKFGASQLGKHFPNRVDDQTRQRNQRQIAADGGLGGIGPQRRAAGSRRESPFLSCQPRHDAAERSSTALSPPKPRRAGLRAIQAAPNDTTASTLIQTSVRA